MLELRDYQLDVLERSEAALDREVRRQLAVLATGLGKTVIFMALIGRRLPEGRALVLAHRDELLAQAVAKAIESRGGYRVTAAARAALVALERDDLLDLVDDAELDAPIVGMVAAAADDVHADIVVASVQTVSQPARLRRLVGDPDAPGLFAPPPPFATIVVDEAHHTPATSYRTVLAALNAGKADGPLLFGVTATPDRGDGHGLDRDYSEVIASYDTLWGIQQGYLCDVRAIEVRLDGFNEADLKKSAGDYTAGSAGAALTAAHAPAVIVKAWEQYADERPTVVFTPTVQVAHDVAATFEDEGWAAAAIDGTTPSGRRKEVLRQLRSGELAVVANCGVLTEGWDEPSIACVVGARPTTSRGLYAQMVGRGLRPHPGKTDCLVLDIVGNVAEHDLVTVPSLFGVHRDPRSRTGERKLSELVAEHADDLAATGELTAAEAALFKGLPRSTIVWLPGVNPKNGWEQWMRPLGRREVRKGEFAELPTVVLIRRHETADEWVTGLVFADGTKRVLIDRVPLATAQGVGEDYVRKHAANVAIVDTNAEWRTRPPTPAQRAAAALNHVTIDPSWSAGQLSDAIDQAKAARRGITKQGAPT